MADPTVKVRVILDDADAIKQASRLGKAIEQSITKAFAAAGKQKNLFPGLQQAIQQAQALNKQLTGTTQALQKFAQSQGQSTQQSQKMANQIKQLQQQVKTLQGNLKQATSTAKAQTGQVSRMTGAFSQFQGVLLKFNNIAFAVRNILFLVQSAVQGLYDTMEGGAVVIQTAASFQRFTDSVIGVPDILDKLNAAARGTVSEFDLMKNTLSLVQGAAPDLARALGQAAPQLLEAARAAAILNPALGDTEHNFDRLALGIRRSSSRILDDLGLVVKLGEAYDNFAIKVGKSVTELTGSERQLALLDQVLLESQNLIGQLGDQVQSAVDPVQQLSASWENLTNKVKAAIAEALLPALRILSGDFYQGLNQVSVAARDLGDSLDDIAIQNRAAQDLEQFKNILVDAAQAQREFEQQWSIFPDLRLLLQPSIGTFEDFNDVTLQGALNAAEAQTAIADYFEAIGQGVDDVEVFIAIVQQFQETLGVNLLETDVWESIVPVLARTTDSFDEFLVVYERVFGVTQGLADPGFQAILRGIFDAGQVEKQTAAWNDYVEAVTAGGLSVQLTAEQLESLQKVFEQVTLGSADFTKQIADLQVSLGQLTQAEADAQLAGAELQRNFLLLQEEGDLFGLTGEQIAIALGALTLKYVDTIEGAIEFATAQDQARAGAREAALEYVRQTSTLENLNKTFEQIKFGAAEFTAEIAALQVELGLLSQEEADAALAAGDLQRAYEQLLIESEFFNLTAEQQIAAIGLLALGYADSAEGAIAMATATDAASVAAQQNAIAHVKQTEAIQQATEAQDAYTQGIAKFLSETLKAKDGVGEFSVQLIEAAAEAGATGDQLIALAASLGVLTDGELKAAAVSGELAEFLADLQKQVQAGALSAEQAGKAWLEYAAALSIAADAAVSLGNAQQGFSTFIDTLGGFLSGGGGGGGGGSLIDSAKTFRDTFIDTIRGVAEAQADLDRAIEEGESEEKIGELTDALNEASGATTNWKNRLFDLAIEAGASVEQVIALGLATGQLTEAQAEAAFKQAAAAAAIEKIADAYVSGAISAEEAVDAVGTLTDQIESGGQIDLSAFGINVGNLAAQTARAGSAAGGAAQQVETWRDSLLNLRGDANATTAEMARLAKETGRYTDEQIAAALAADAMDKAAGFVAESLASQNTTVEDGIEQLENLEGVLGQLSLEDLTAFLDVEALSADFDVGDLAAAIQLFLDEGGAVTVEQAIKIILGIKEVEVEGAVGGADTPGGISDGLKKQLLPEGEVEIDIPVSADTSAADESVGTLRGDLLALDEQETVPEINADNSDAEEKIDETAESLGELDGEDAEVLITADNSQAIAALNEFLDLVPDLVNIKIQADIDANTNTGGGAGATPDTAASRGARVLPGDVILVGDSGRPDPSEMFVSDAWVSSGGSLNSGPNAPLIVGRSGPSFFAPQAAGWVIPQVYSDAADIMAAISYIKDRDNVYISGDSLPEDDVERSIARFRAGEGGFVIFDPDDFNEYPRISEIGQFNTGGYTGDKGGVVHPREFVFSPAATENLGVDTLSALHTAAQNGSIGNLVDSIMNPQSFALNEGRAAYDFSQTENHADNRREVNITVANPYDAGIVLRREIGTRL